MAGNFHKWLAIPRNGQLFPFLEMAIPRAVVRDYVIGVGTTIVALNISVRHLRIIALAGPGKFFIPRVYSTRNIMTKMRMLYARDRPEENLMWSYFRGEESFKSDDFVKQIKCACHLLGKTGWDCR